MISLVLCTVNLHCTFEVRLSALHCGIQYLSKQTENLHRKSKSGLLFWAARIMGVLIAQTSHTYISVLKTHCCVYECCGFVLGCLGVFWKKHRHRVPLLPTPRSPFQPTLAIQISHYQRLAPLVWWTPVWVWLVKPHGARLEENLENPCWRNIHPSRQSDESCSIHIHTNTHFYPSFKVGQWELHLAVFSTTHSLLLSALMRCLWRGYCWSLESLR